MKSAGFRIGMGLLIVLVAVGGLAAFAHYRNAGSGNYACNDAKPGELCASADFYSEYVKWKALQVELGNLQKASIIETMRQKQDQFNGMTQRLNSSMPSGYGWDEQKLRFTKLPESTKPATPVPPPSPK
jgi:hypothetical protein